ncbi:MAG: cytochrome b6-f complex iron-sulfur subunit [Thermodesulfobacteriota bacterium]|nr:cytochrome b6-f complex iron-sulfur subunit [Thermodesulfobacteriota bacterium]
MERRGFIKKGLQWAASLLGASFLAYPAFSFMTFRKATKKRIVFHPEDQAGAVTFKEGVYLIREPNEIFALSAQCTHLGCTLNYDAVSGRFACPCHGSVFTLSGKRISGPARKDLYRVPLTKTASGDIEAVLEVG